MSTTQSKSVPNADKPLLTTAKRTDPKITIKKESPSPAKADAIKAEEFPVHNQIAPFSVKKKKNDKVKVIRDSFSFPEQDHHKITELKKICLAAGVHVKKGEILRAGLILLTNLNLTELMAAVEKVEKVQTGRPKTAKNNH
jgi:hypothetical protein